MGWKSMSRKPPFRAMIVNSGAWVFLASRYDTIAKGETEPTEQMLELSYSRARQTAMSSSMVQDELADLTRWRDRTLGVTSWMRVRAQVERNVPRDASGFAPSELCSVGPGDAALIAGPFA